MPQSIQPKFMILSAPARMRTDYVKHNLLVNRKIHRLKDQRNPDFPSRIFMDANDPLDQRSRK